MQTEGTIDALQKNNAPKILAQCNLQVLWLLKNKELSHWVKLYTNNKEGVIIGQLKISISFFRNKSFAPEDVSNLVDYSPEKLYEN